MLQPGNRQHSAAASFTSGLVVCECFLLLTQPQPDEDQQIDLLQRRGDPGCIIASIFAFVSVPSVCGASACTLLPCCLHLPRLFSNFLSSSARVSPLSHFVKCLRSSVDRQLRLDRQLSPPHPGESRPPRWSVCHNKSVCRRCSNACEGLCVLVRGGLGGTLGCHTCQPGMR